jgi:hypothetical protein
MPERFKASAASFSPKRPSELPSFAAAAGTLNQLGQQKKAGRICQQPRTAWPKPRNQWKNGARIESLPSASVGGITSKSRSETPRPSPPRCPSLPSVYPISRSAVAGRKPTPSSTCCIFRRDQLLPRRLIATEGTASQLGEMICPLPSAEAGEGREIRIAIAGNSLEDFLGLIDDPDPLLDAP